MEGFYQKLLIYVVIIILACLITLFTFDTWRTVVLAVLLLTAASYLVVLGLDKLTTLNCTNIKEGFVSESSAEVSKYEWLGNDDLFDDLFDDSFADLFADSFDGSFDDSFDGSFDGSFDDSFDDSLTASFTQ